jgi:transcriptional regulator with XRE-family HTH domain
MPEEAAPHRTGDVLDMRALASRVRDRMEAESLTQTALAERVEKSAGSVSLALSGEPRYASTLATLAEAVGLRVEGPFPAYRVRPGDASA